MDTVDETLIERARHGDDLAWRALLQRYTPMLRSIASRYRLSPDDAADAVQNTWLRCVEHLDRIRDPGAIPGWLATVCRRESLSLALGARAVPWEPSVLAECPELAADSLDPADEVVARDEAAVVRSAVARLPDRQQRVLTAFLDTPPCRVRYRTVATHLGMPQGSLGPTRMRALRRLARDPEVSSRRAAAG